MEKPPIVDYCFARKGTGPKLTFVRKPLWPGPLPIAPTAFG